MSLPIFIWSSLSSFIFWLPNFRFMFLSFTLVLTILLFSRQIHKLPIGKWTLQASYLGLPNFYIVILSFCMDIPTFSKYLYHDVKSLPKLYFFISLFLHYFYFIFGYNKSLFTLLANFIWGTYHPPPIFTPILKGKKKSNLPPLTN